ncbi:MAG: TonB-dependent receptor [Acidobacteriaceae bacterium]|nr:TonB-dependent receptor [Acidobacteriaceae bacterium]
MLEGFKIHYFALLPKWTRFTQAALLVILASLLSVLSFAQSTSGNITGTIYDQTGATVPGATVTAKNQETGVESTATATSAGNYRIENLPVGTYTVTVNAPGFSKVVVNNVNVPLNQTVTANATLQIGTSSTSVNVTESAVAIDTTTAQLQSTFETRQIADTPTTSTGAGVINLSLLAPGVATSGAVGAGTGPSVGGQRPRNNNFTVEGLDNNSGSVTGPLVTIPNDAVAEFTLLTNQFSPDFGHSSGGQFNQVVRSGTNEFHGSLYEYFQNRNLNAANNFSAVTGTPLHPRYDNNRFGGTFGGPIRRNKLFFFVDYEYNPVGQAGSAGLLFAPTAAGYNTIASTPGINQTNLNIMKQYLGTATTPASPSAVGANGGGYPLLSTLAAGPAYNQTNFTGVPIEVGKISIPTPNYFNNERGVGSVDYNLSDKDSMRGRFILNRNGVIDNAASLPVFFAIQPTNNYLVAFSEYHNFTPNVINELRLGYNRQSQIFPVGNQTFPGLDQFPNLVLNELGAQIGPDPNAPQFGYQNNYQLTDNITFTKGAHSFKFGFDGIRFINPQSFTQRSRGDYDYNFLNDYLFDFGPDYLAQRSQGSFIYWGNRWLLGWYGNDTWKIRPNLTLNIGLRYEYQTVPAGEQVQSLNAASSVPGLITFGVPQAQGDALMPRIGLAYSPGTSGKTSIRAGFGINYDVLFDNFGLLTLPPQVNTTVDLTNIAPNNFLANGGIPPTGPGANLTVAKARALTGGYVPNQTRPKSLQWNFGIQQEFAKDYVFEIRYLGTRGEFLPVQDQINRQPTVNAATALPVYWANPGQATLNSLTNTLSGINAAFAAKGNIIPAYLAAGFTGIVTSYQPLGNSIYHGLATQLTRRFTNGLQIQGSYTLSHNIDDSTAEVFSTYLTPRRSQDSTNLRQDRASSALDHRNRLTLQVIYDLPYFKQRNWFLKNLVGNWEFLPVYTYQTGTLYTIQSGADSNLNGDSAGDRVFVNPNGGNPSLGSGTTSLKNSAGQVVGYLVTNPNAKYATAPRGTLPNAGRNTGMLNPINDIDFAATKRFNFTERASFSITAQVYNILNHPQYVGGSINDVGAIGATSTNQHNFTIPTSSYFGLASQVFSSNPRTMVLVAKFNF